MKASAPPLTPRARLLALVIACAAGAALWAQFRVSQALTGFPPAAATLWLMAGYFTILTKIAVALIMVAAAAGTLPG